MLIKELVDLDLGVLDSRRVALVGRTTLGNRVQGFELAEGVLRRLPEVRLGRRADGQPGDLGQREPERLRADLEADLLLGAARVLAGERLAVPQLQHVGPGRGGPEGKEDDEGPADCLPAGYQGSLLFSIKCMQGTMDKGTELYHGSRLLGGTIQEWLNGYFGFQPGSAFHLSYYHGRACVC